MVEADMSIKMEKISVIIVNYNGKDFVGECIDSVLVSDYPNFEVVIVDNASADGSYAYLQKKYARNKKVKIVRSAKQLYFTGGANLGAKKAKGELLFFLNSDTVAEKNCLKNLAEFINNHSKYIVQPKIIKSSNNLKSSLLNSNIRVIDNVGGKYTFWGFGLGIGNGELDKGQYDKNLQIDFANGTAFLIKRDFFTKLGGFDESYRFFYEDVDLCLRAQKMGGKCWYCYSATIYHKGALSFNQHISARNIRFYIRRNRILTLLKNQKIPVVLFKLPVLVAITLAIYILDSIKDIVKGDIFKIVKSSSIVFLGTNIVNALNFAFAVIMARLLGPKDFGEMAALFSLLILVGIPSGMITTVMAKYISDYQARNNFGLIKKFVKSASRYSIVSGILLLAVFWSLTPFLSKFLNINYLPFVIFGFTFPISFLSAVYVGMLQGLQRFIPFSLTTIIATIVKLILAIMFVLLGFSVSGIVLAFVVGLFISYLYAISKARSYLATISSSQRQNSINLPHVRQEIFSYAKTILSTTFLLAIFSSIDMVLVKHYLSAQLAGQYAALATVGRITFYGVAPMLMVVFPMISAAHTAKNGKEDHILKTSLSLILAIALLGLLVLAFMPELVVKILFGSQYLPISSFLVWYGVVVTLHTLSRTFINYFLATEAKTFLYPLAISAVLQTVLIVLFHQTFLAIIISLLLANMILFLACLGIYHYGK